jgi:hypothetical protein
LVLKLKMFEGDDDMDKTWISIFRIASLNSWKSYFGLEIIRRLPMKVHQKQTRGLPMKLIKEKRINLLLSSALL